MLLHNIQWEIFNEQVPQAIV